MGLDSIECPGNTLRPVMWLKMGLERKENPIIPAFPICWALYKHDSPRPPISPIGQVRKPGAQKGTQVMCKVGAQLRAVRLQHRHSLHRYPNAMHQSQGEQQTFNKHSFVNSRQLLLKILLLSLPLQIFHRNCYLNHNNRSAGKLVKQQGTS